jgi:hypothetical protein
MLQAFREALNRVNINQKTPPRLGFKPVAIPDTEEV